MKKLRTPYPFQEAAIAIASRRSRCALFLDPGLGKTLISMRCLDVRNNKTLAIVPASLRMNWEEERKKEQVPVNMIQIESYEWLVKMVSGLKHGLKTDQQIRNVLKRNFGIYKNLIVDESHYIKNPTAKRTKALLDIQKFIRNIYFLTGSPYGKSSTEMFTTLSICEPGVWGNYKEFGEKYANEVINSYTRKKEYRGVRNEEELNERIKSCTLTIKKEDVLRDLPKLRESRLILSGGNGEYSSYVGELNAHIAEVRQEAAFDKMNDYAKAFKFRQIKGGIIFCWHKDVAEALGKKIKAPVISGDVSIEKRYELIEMFQTEQVDNIIITISSGGVGLNIQRANYVGFFEMPFTYAEVDQALSRAFRIGNKNLKLHVEYVILRDSIDEAIYRIIMKRRKQSKDLIKGQIQ